MSTYALLKDNVVTYMLVAESAIIDTLVAVFGCTNAIKLDSWEGVFPEVDYTWDGSNFSPPTPIYDYTISRDEFFSRLTDNEYGGLIQLSNRDDAIGTKVSGFLRWLEILGAINLQEQRVVDGFQWLVDQGYVTSERRNELLTPIRIN